MIKDFIVASSPAPDPSLLDKPLRTARVPVYCVFRCNDMLQDIPGETAFAVSTTATRKGRLDRMKALRRKGEQPLREQDLHLCETLSPKRQNCGGAIAPGSLASLCGETLLYINHRVRCHGHCFNLSPTETALLRDRFYSRLCPPIPTSDDPILLYANGLCSS
ncbi:hypothetical protein SKAU_G00230450 [Synaphobranchus kaupii]|uniref:Uncharacterized protein n=1 Tax=Synaphobranchus kaupii TaxID=118154 RepID=A0A9Q1F5Y3_SYNKA|nr:hypothetical protein SKAU_G00230450 [Synaphobranchus kaupii]